MQLRMPEDVGTIEALVEETKRTTNILVLYFSAGQEAPAPGSSNSWNTPSWEQAQAPQPTQFWHS